MITQIKGPQSLHQRIKVLHKKQKIKHTNGSRRKETATQKQKCYINGLENLSVLNMYFIEVFVILLFSSKLQVWHPYNKRFSKASSVRVKMSFEIFLRESKGV